MSADADTPEPPAPSSKESPDASAVDVQSCDSTQAVKRPVWPSGMLAIEAQELRPDPQSLDELARAEPINEE